MHSYAVEKSRIKIAFTLAVISLGISACFKWGLDFFQTDFLNISWGGCFVAIYFIFDRFLWKIKPIRMVLKLHNLNGEWNCIGKGFDLANREMGEWKAKIVITQSWSKIFVVVKTDQSTSESYMGVLEFVPGRGYKLSYNYRNKVKLDANDMKDHSGVCEIYFNDANSGEGEYFNFSGRLTRGRIKVSKKGAV